MANWLVTVTGALKAASDSVQKLMELREFVKHADTLGKLHAQILGAQQVASTAYARESDMAEEIRDLKAKMAELEGWNAEKERYRLVELALGVVAYAPKEADGIGEPHHLLCPNCFASDKKRFLQAITKGEYFDRYRCNDCGQDLPVNKGTPPPMRFAPGPQW